MNVPVTPGSLPSGYCPLNYQDLLNNFAANMTVQVPSALSQIVWQSTAPQPGANTAWGKLDTLGRPIGIFFFAQGAWLMPQPFQPGVTVWWFSALPDFTIFDGGDGNPVSAISGPMWQQAKDGNGNLIAAAFPMVAGTLPSGTVTAIGGTGGEENHILVPGEDVPHQHSVANTDASGTGIVAGGGPFIAEQNNNSNNGLAYQLAGGSTIPNLAPTGVAGGQQTIVGTAGVVNPQGYSQRYQAKGHNNLPPYVVGYLLQRTNRLFYIG